MRMDRELLTAVDDYRRVTNTSQSQALRMLVTTALKVRYWDNQGNPIGDVRDVHAAAFHEGFLKGLHLFTDHMKKASHDFFQEMREKGQM